MDTATRDRLYQLGLQAMVAEWDRQAQDPAATALSCAERLALLVDAQWLARTQRQYQRRLQEAHLRLPATPEGIEWHAPRQWPTSVVRELLGGTWIAHHQTVLITGPTGVGKSYLLCALGHMACRHNWRVRYYRLPQLCTESALARQHGTWFRWLQQVQRWDLLCLDDWALYPITVDESRDLLEILDGRLGTRALAIASQVPVAQWHQWLPDPTLADAILDRLVHHAHTIAIQGESMRKYLSASPGSATTEPPSQS